MLVRSLEGTIYHFIISRLHPGRLTWNLRMHPWKRKIIFQTIIFTFYVNLPGCSLFSLRGCHIFSCHAVVTEVCRSHFTLKPMEKLWYGAPGGKGDMEGITWAPNCQA